MNKVEHDVFIDKNGECYCHQGAHRVFDYMTGELNVSEQSLKNFEENILSRQQYCVSHRIPYCHLVGPDKQSVYVPSLPLKNLICLGEQYYEKQRSSFVYPLTALKKSPHRTYFKTDSHWNPYGQLIGFEHMALALGVSDSNVELAKNQLMKSILNSNIKLTGDLGVKLTPNHHENLVRFNLNWNFAKFSNGIHSFGNEGIIEVIVSGHPRSKGKLLIFGDSFSRIMLDCWATLFETIVFCRTKFFHKEVVDAVQPHAVITQNVERYLANVVSDKLAVNFLLTPYLKGRSPIFNQQDILAISAIFSGSPQMYRDFILPVRKKLRCQE